MARPGLTRHRKFARLSRLLGSSALARGHLELLWDVAYENGDEFLGDAGDLEHLGEWQGEAGKLASALVESGFVDRDGDEYRVHDLFDHAPEYVKKRYARETERKEKGKTLRDVRSDAARARWEKEESKRMQLDAACNANGHTPAPAPAPAPAQTEAGAEASSPPSPVVVVCPCVGHGAHDYAVTQAQIDEWTPVYPGVDVKAEVLKAKAWLDANPTKRKTQSGVPRFLVSWLGRSQDDAGRNAGKAPKPKVTAPAEVHTHTGRVAL